MTRTATRHTIFALAVSALASVVAASPVSAQRGNEYLNQLQWSHGQLAPSTPKGLAAKNSSQCSRSIARPDVQKGLSLSDEQKKPARPAFKPGQPRYGDIQFTINE
jgi:hypothetical protein